MSVTQTSPHSSPTDSLTQIPPQKSSILDSPSLVFGLSTTAFAFAYGAFVMKRDYATSIRGLWGSTITAQEGKLHILQQQPWTANISNKSQLSLAALGVVAVGIITGTVANARWKEKIQHSSGQDRIHARPVIEGALFGFGTAFWTWAYTVPAAAAAAVILTGNVLRSRLTTAQNEAFAGRMREVLNPVGAPMGLRLLKGAVAWGAGTVLGFGFSFRIFTASIPWAMATGSAFTWAYVHRQRKHAQ